MNSSLEYFLYIYLFWFYHIMVSNSSLILASTELSIKKISTFKMKAQINKPAPMFKADALMPNG